MVGMARRAVPARVAAGGTNNRRTLPFEGAAPLNAERPGCAAERGADCAAPHDPINKDLLEEAALIFRSASRPCYPFSGPALSKKWGQKPRIISVKTQGCSA